MKLIWFLTIFLTKSVFGDEIIKNQTTLGYDPEELLIKIFNASHTILPRQAGYGQIKFEDQPDFNEDVHRQYGLISFEGQTASQQLKFEYQNPNGHVNNVNIRDGNTKHPLKFEDEPNFYSDDAAFNVHQDNGIRDDNRQPLIFEDQRPTIHSEDNPINNGNTNSYVDNTGVTDGGQVTFQDDNRIDGQGQKKKKRRKRKRKPRRQQVKGPLPLGYQPGTKPGFPGYLGPNSYVNTGFQGGQFYRPPRRPKPSVASEALSAVTGALTSIALYDDYQCVPRLLCEAAGGGALGTGALGAGSSGLLQSVAGLQPLLTLLSAYNGISTSPLFVFGRAVFLGMTSKANPGTCRYAYPLCPTDPEQLVHYLNNHNGGFFRFFGAPHLANPQFGPHNVEQFYNQLLAPGQNYGIYRPEQLGHQPNGGQGHDIGQQSYGTNNNLANHQSNHGFQRPNLYNGYQQSYGPNYPYNQNKHGFNKAQFKSNEEVKDIKSYRIEKRIQNSKPDAYVDDHFNNLEQNSKWLFPEDSYNVNHLRDSKHFTFPGDSSKIDSIPIEPNRKAKGFFFPGIQSNRQYEENFDYPPDAALFYNNDFKLENSFENHDTQMYQVDGNDEEGVELVYVVRGNGDPNNPEIIKLRPGQYVQ